MKNFWSEIAVPATILALTLAQTVGVETSRAVRTMHIIGRGIEVADTVRTEADSLAAGALRADSLVADTLSRDSLQTDTVKRDSTGGWDDDFDFFGEEAAEDTVPKVFARDTMKVPDSLKLTDPFLYEWYVAVKDSFTHRLVVDSLKAEGDSLIWPRVDSLYLADSTAAAQERFRIWYAGLTKAERKRYDYEQKLPAILHRQDSIFHIKDSIKARRDSIRQNTPRILDSGYIPDSLQYKRLIAWTHDPAFNRIETFQLDTTADYHFNDFPYMKKDVGGSFLGMPGSPVQTYNFFLRDDVPSISYFAPYESWTYAPSTIPMFNTKTPYTELSYYGNLLNSSTKSSDDFRIFTTQNILPSLNIALEIKRHGGAGTLKNDKQDNKTMYAVANWLGKRYLAHGGIIHNKVSRTENGGIIDNYWIRDTTVDVREIDVALSDATNKYKKTTLFFDQSYRIPLSDVKDFLHRKDTTYTPSETDDTDELTTFIGSSTDWSVYTKKYVDAVSASTPAGDDFYHGVYYLNPTKSADSLRSSILDNKIFLRVQPWHQDAIVSKIEGGIGDKLENYYLLRPSDYLYKQKGTVWNSAYLYAGAEGMIHRYVNWDALGEYTFAGARVNDFSIKANARLSFYPFRRHKDSPVTVSGRFSTDLKEPGFYEQHFYSNHYKWENDFSKVSTTKVEGGISIPRWGFSLSAGYALLSGNIYYDTLGIIRQNVDPMSVISATLKQNFAFAGDLIHLDHKALLQFSSNEAVLPLPTVALNFKYYLQFFLGFNDAMKMQLGVNAHYNTAWYAPGYNPVAGVFVNQTEEKYGNDPRFDIFANIQWKKVCLFVKFENAGKGWPMERHDYFSAHHYIHPPSVVKVGITWPFYPSLGGDKTLSDRAGSAMGGGSGAGGSALGGLKGAASGIGGGR